MDLLRTNPPGAPHGFNEANKVLAHALKDKTKSLDGHRSHGEGWSAFLVQSCSEALEALDKLAIGKGLHVRHSGMQHWDSYHHPSTPAGHAGGRSAPSSSGYYTPGASSSSGQSDHEGPEDGAGRDTYRHQGMC